MPDLLDRNGLTTKTADEIRSDLVSKFQLIYGADINVDSNSPDGQIIGELTQVSVDIRELAQYIYNSFNPDRAIGVQLDERVVINNIQRKGGTYTNTPVDITVSQTVTLSGLDADYSNPNAEGYTVQDDAGNEFILIDTVTLTAGTHSLSFRAKEIGEVDVTVGTITNPVTVVLGVTTINNSSAPTSVGQDEETDAQLRVRRQQSVAISSNGYLNGLLGNILSLDGVNAAVLYENITNVVDSDGIPAHGIWLIVDGGANSDIANVLYNKKSCGCDMRGSVTVDIETDSGALFVAKFDRPQSDDLHIRFDIQPTVSGASFSQSLIKDYIVDNIDYGIGDFAETSEITEVARAAISDQGGDGVAINVEISEDGSTWVDYLAAVTKDSQWTIDAARITITEL